LEEDVSQPLLEKKCMMAKVSGTNVQMEVFSWTHLVRILLIKFTDFVDKIMDPSHGPISSKKNA
jgi:hypothetical protein